LPWNASGRRHHSVALGPTSADGSALRLDASQCFVGGPFEFRNLRVRQGSKAVTETRLRNGSHLKSQRHWTDDSRFGAVVSRARVEVGATIVGFGVGGIGLNCVQGGVLSGAAKISAVDVMPQKLERARRFGATHVIDASTCNPVEAVRDLSGGGVDYSFECVGNIGVVKQALESIAPGGTMTIVGVPKVGTSFDFVVHALTIARTSWSC